MKKVKFVILMIVLVAFTSIIVFYVVNHLIDSRVLENEEKQVILLEKIYDDHFTKQPMNEYGIILKDSTFKNFITKQYFNDINIEKLKNRMTVDENYSKYHVLNIKGYVPKSHILTLNFDIVDKDQNLLQTTTIEYKLSVEDNEIKYEEKNSTIAVFSRES